MSEHPAGQPECDRCGCRWYHGDWDACPRCFPGPAGVLACAAAELVAALDFVEAEHPAWLASGTITHDKRETCRRYLDRNRRAGGAPARIPNLKPATEGARDGQ